MRYLVVCWLSYILFFINLSFAEQVHDRLGDTHIQFETLEKIPRDYLDISFPKNASAKLAFILFKPSLRNHNPNDYDQVIKTGHIFQLSKYNILRFKNYFLII